MCISPHNYNQISSITYFEHKCLTLMTFISALSLRSTGNLKVVVCLEACILTISIHTTYSCTTLINTK